MGISKSKERKPEGTTVYGEEDQPFCAFLFRRRRIRIDNQSSVNSRVIITPGPITNLKSLQIEKLGAIELENTGEYRPQKFHILSKRSKSPRVKVREFYITCLLQIKDEQGNQIWGFLWENRLFSCFEDVCIVERHIDEALLDAHQDVCNIWTF
jgi:hypothetical protein